jgi:hypothetical protein
LGRMGHACPSAQGIAKAPARAAMIEEGD